MANEAESKLRADATESLSRIQEFDPDTLAREDELGKHFAFHDAVGPARRLVELYGRLPISALDDLPTNELQQVKAQADADFNRFSEVLEFDPKEAEATQRRQQLIAQIETSYQQAFTRLSPFISYAVYKTTDFQRLDEEARATLQSLQDEGAKLTAALEEQRQRAEEILVEIRKVAAEQGVTQQAIFFKESADAHDGKADEWRRRTLWTALGLGLYAIISIFLHELPWLAPDNTYETVQLAVSKILIFTVISYVMYLSARNFLAHAHNAIVDRHRQNALLTYTALVEAAGETPNREVILVQAAACIFGAQGTGYGHEPGPHPPGAQSVVEFLSRPLRSGGDDAT